MRGYGVICCRGSLQPLALVMFFSCLSPLHIGRYCIVHPDGSSVGSMKAWTLLRFVALLLFFVIPVWFASCHVLDC